MKKGNERAEKIKMANQEELRKQKLSKKKIYIILLLTFGIVLSVLAYSTNPERQEQKGQSTENILEEEQKEKFQAVVDEMNYVIEENFQGIICWGDSLTQGLEINYPLVLSEIIRENIIEEISVGKMTNPEYKYFVDEYLDLINTPEVINMGVASESSITIAGRAGGIPYITAEDIVIPSQAEAVELHFTSANGRIVIPFNPGYCGLEDIMISSVSGDLSVDVDEAKKERNYYFTRREVGNCVEVPTGTEIITYGATHYLDYLPVIYIGTNGGYEDSQDLIEQQRAIINHYEGNHDHFIIIGIHTGTAEERKELEKAMEKEYGDNYINLREYMCTLAIDDANELLNAGISITDHDKEMIEEGKTPASLMSKDELHFNSYGYELIGKLIYDRMVQLGYFDELQKAIEESTDTLWN